MGNGEERARGLRGGGGTVLILFLFRARRDPIE
jgi:hypothetical protein